MLQSRRDVDPHQANDRDREENIIMKNIRIGVINWDASLTRDTYFGYYQTRSLSQAKYRTWVPYYADIIDEERIDYHFRSVAEYEQELQYAIDAGIDYFAFVWYPTEGSLLHEQRSPIDCSHRVHELNYARHLYEKSTLTDKLGMCAILSGHPFTDHDLSDLVTAFEKPYYEKIDGRPLLYVYHGNTKETILHVHALCKERGIPTPFTVPMFTSAEVLPLADAVSAYAAYNPTDVDRYDALCRFAIEQDLRRMQTGKPIIPLFTVGWNPTPRMERLTPWTTNAQGDSSYLHVNYAPAPTETELTEGAAAFADHIKNNVKEKFAGHILTFAWNEFEEGGYICPTYREDSTVNDTRIHAFAQTVEIFRSELENA